jgi:hypothetical protein
MAIRFTSTREAATLHGVKVLVYGAAGSGKTSLCATTGGSPVIISAEAGLLSLRASDIPVIVVESHADVLDAYRFLTESVEAAQFDWVCLDSLSEIGEVALASLKSAHKDPRQAYGALIDEMGDLVRRFRDLPNKNVYMSAKLDRVKDDASGLMYFGPSMPGTKTGAQLPYFFDLCLALKTVPDAEGAPTRVLQTNRDASWEAKDRSGALDFYEAPNLAAIAAKVRGVTPPAMTQEV